MTSASCNTPGCGICCTSVKLCIIPEYPDLRSGRPDLCYDNPVIIIFNVEQWQMGEAIEAGDSSQKRRTVGYGISMVIFTVPMNYIVTAWPGIRLHIGHEIGRA